MTPIYGNFGTSAANLYDFHFILFLLFGVLIFDIGIKIIIGTVCNAISIGRGLVPSVLLEDIIYLIIDNITPSSQP